jgi:hypothetical protein
MALSYAARAPGAGEEVIRPPAEQERVGALVHLVDEVPGCTR